MRSSGCRTSSRPCGSVIADNRRNGRFLSQLGASLGVSHTTARAYIELLARTFMVRVQPAFLPNSAKRLVKSPKIGPEPALMFQGRSIMEHQPGYRPPRVVLRRAKKAEFHCTFCDSS